MRYEDRSRKRCRSRMFRASNATLDQRSQDLNEMRPSSAGWFGCPASSAEGQASLPHHATSTPSLNRSARHLHHRCITLERTMAQASWPDPPVEQYFGNHAKDQARRMGAIIPVDAKTRPQILREGLATLEAMSS